MRGGGIAAGAGSTAPTYQQQTGREPKYPEPVSVAIGVSRSGAGCTLGDIIGAWIVFAAAFKLLGLALPAEYIADFTLGIAFQYLAIAPMRDLGPKDGIIAALKADTLLLTAFEIGLFGWMAICSSSSSHPRTSRPTTPHTGF